MATMISKQQSSDALTATIQPPIQVTAVGNYEWSTTITSNADARGSLSVAYGSSRPVTYSVVAVRRPAFTFYVSGVIKVANSNDAPVAATAVSAQMPAGYVPASCQGRAGILVPAGGSVLCAFNASITDPTPGSITAVAVSSFGTSASTTPVPYSVDAAIAGAKGACAVLSDALTSTPTLPKAGVAISDNRPYSADAKPVCTSSSYNFTVGFGPFDQSACNAYAVSPAVPCSVLASCDHMCYTASWLGIRFQAGPDEHTVALPININRHGIAQQQHCMLCCVSCFCMYIGDGRGVCLAPRPAAGQFNLQQHPAAQSGWLPCHSSVCQRRQH